MSMRNPALFSRIFNTPLMIHPMKLDAILAGIGGRFGLEIPPSMLVSNHDQLLIGGIERPHLALTQTGEYMGRGFQVIGTVAVIDIIGVLAHRGGLQADSSYILGYDLVGKQLAAALEDPAIKSILLQIDTPGGEVAGAFELAAQIRQARDTKPINAVISSMAASAGFLLASAAGDIAISDTGIAGSIGVVLRHIDASKMAEKEGFNVTYIFAGGHKIDGNPYEPLPDTVKADIQTQINKLYGLFVTTVAANLGLSTEAVRAQEAAIYTGQDAIDAGLADRISTPDEMLAEMQSLSTTTQRGIFMSAPTAENAALEQQALEKSRAEGFTAGTQEGFNQGVKAERERIAAILNHESTAGHEGTAKTMALETDMSAEQVTKVLASMPKPEPAKPANGTEFSKHMAALGNPKIGPDDEGGEDDGGDSDEEESAKIVALFNRNKGAK